jgi:TPP-dependent pyruvate/acetoin dehydrogenase alpha subunit
VASLTREELRDLYRVLLLTRGLEERLELLFKQGRIVGNLYRSLGQEATAVGSASALEEEDWLSPSTRDLGALLARGLQPREMLLQYMARAGSPSEGKDNVNHFTLPALGLLGPISPLGTQLCVLNGIALAFRMRGEPRVCMTYQGEGATRTGASHEGLNFAAVQRLPMVVVVEHNRWAYATRSARQAAVADWLDVASAYGVPAASVDGNDVLAVYDEARRAVGRARRGDGMTIIVAETYRMLGHAQHDPQDYVPEVELEEWRARDPIAGFEDYLVESGFKSRAALAVIKEGVRRELLSAVDEALAAPMPAAAEARFGTFESEAASVPWTRREAVYDDLLLPPVGSEAGAS